jgi:hypothetical protein
MPREHRCEFGVAVDERPWAREVQLVDPDGNRLRVAQSTRITSADDVLGDGATAELIGLERAMWGEATRGDPAWMNRGDGNRSSLWVRRRGRWRLEFHQGTPARH